MLKLSTAAKSADSSFLNKTWSILILCVAFAYAVLTIFVGNPLESRGFSKKQMDAAFTVVVITLCFIGMSLSKDKNASLEVEVERLLRESYKPRVSEPF
jgi:Kef-type K+ transport system membrane component KefB